MFSSASCSISASIRRFLRDRSGATAIEYAVIASGIAVAIAATVFNLGTSVQGMYSGLLAAMR